MLATLDSFRETLEDLGGGLGVTDPVAGPVVLSVKSLPLRSAKHTGLALNLALKPKPY
jgi:hypothetical protein